MANLTLGSDISRQSRLSDVAALVARVYGHRGREGVWAEDLRVNGVMRSAVEFFGICELNGTRKFDGACELPKRGERCLSEAIQTLCQAHEIDRRVAGSLFWKSYSYAVALPAIVAWVRNESILDLGVDNVALRFSCRRPHATLGMLEVREVSPPGSERNSHAMCLPLGADKSEARKHFLHRLLDDHLLLALLAVRRCAGTGVRTLAASLAVAVTHPFATLTTVLGRDLREEQAAVRKALGPIGRLVTIAEARDADGNVEHRPLRLVCCQKTRVVGETNCMSCPLLSPASRADISAFHGVTWEHLPLT